MIKDTRNVDHISLEGKEFECFGQVSNTSDADWVVTQDADCVARGRMQIE